jgi:hypothetical protein
MIAGGQDFVPGAGPRIELLGTPRTVVVRETLAAMCKMCRSSSSPEWCMLIQIASTLSDMSGR